MMPAYLQLLKERGFAWTINRSLYSAKLKSLSLIPGIEGAFEKKTPPIKRIDLFDLNVGALRTFLSSLPDEKKDHVITEAERACHGKIKGFSSVDLDYGVPINWQLNPVTGHVIDSKQKWFKIKDFDASRGDIKVIWEASRFSHFFLLARAYLITGNIKYYEAFSTQLEDWLEKNIYSFGANFKCGQECALRMLSCLMVIPAFGTLVTEHDKKNVEELVSRCYRKILSNFSYAYRCQKNNHAISESVGMIAGAWCCGDSQQMKKAYKYLENCIENQFYEDGGYAQQSFNYQRLAIQDIEALLSVSKKTGLNLSEAALNKIKKSILLMYQCLDQSGDMPNYGSNDGALIFPVHSCGYRDFRPTINSAYALIARKKLFDSGPYDEELIWFAGTAEYPVDKVKQVSSSFPEAGLYTLRKQSAWLMLVSKKEINHMDQNHVDVWINGKNVLCDAGTYSYASELGKELFSTKAHNTACCKGKEQINRIGPFAVYGQPIQSEIEFDGGKIISHVKFQNGYSHKRIVEIIDGGFLIQDTVDSGNCIIIYHTPYRISNNRCEIDIQDICTLSTDSEIICETARRSLYYLQDEEATAIIFKPKNNRIVTKIIAYEAQ